MDDRRPSQSRCGLMAVSVALPILAMALGSPAQAQYGAPAGVAQVFENQDVSGAVPLGWRNSYLRVRHQSNEGVGFDDGYTTFGAFLPVYQSTFLGQVDGLTFLEPQISVTNDAEVVANLGAGHRWFNPAWNRTLGSSVWFDYDDGHRQTFTQVAFGIESRGQWIDVFANAYVPLERRKEFESEFFGASPILQTTPSYVGRSLVLARNAGLATLITQYEAAMSGADFEAGGRIPYIPMDMRVYGGWYFFQVDGSEDVYGAQGRFEGFVTPDISTHVWVSDDNTFGTNVLAGISWYFGGGGVRGRRDARARMIEPTHRRDRIVITEQIVRTENVPAPAAPPIVLIDPATGLPITIVHVDSRAGEGGDGSFAAPFNDLQEAQAGSAPGNIILVHVDSVFSNPANNFIALQANQRFLGEGPGVTHLVNTQAGAFALPPTQTGGASRPVITGATADAIRVVQNNEVNNFIIDGAARGIAGSPGAADTLVQNMLIRNTTGDGINIQPSTRTTILDSTFENIGGAAINLNAADTRIGRVNINGAAGGGIVLRNTSGTTQIGNATITNAFGAGGIFIENATGQHLISDSTIFGGSTGIDLRNAGGNIQILRTDITNTTVAGLGVVGGNGTIIYQTGTISENNAGLVANIQGRAGGLIDLNADIVATGLSGGINVTGSTGANTIRFDGLTDLGTGAGALLGGTAVLIDNNGQAGAVVSFANLDIVLDDQFVNPFVGFDARNGGNVVVSRGTILASGQAIELNDTNVNMAWLSVTSQFAPAEAIDINNVGGTFAVQGVTTIFGSGGTGIDITNSAGNFSFAAVDIDNPSGSAANFNNVASAAINGGFIDGVFGPAAVVSVNTNVTVSSVTFGANSLIFADAISVQNNDAVGRNAFITLNTIGDAGLFGNPIFGRGVVIESTGAGTLNAVVNNNTIASTGNSIETDDNGAVPAQLVLALNGNTLEATSAAGDALNVTGNALNSTIVTSFDGNTAVGNGLGGGMLFNRVTFDSTGTDLLGGRVFSGITQIGDVVPLPAPPTFNRVDGAGLSLVNTSGSLFISELNIFNQNGTGLLADTTGLGTTFEFGTLDGDINTENGTAVDIDSVDADVFNGINFETITATGSPAQGIVINNLGPNATPAQQVQFNVNGLTTVNGGAPGAAGIQITNSGNADFSFARVDIDNKATGVLVNGADSVTILGGAAALASTIDGGTTGIDVTNSSLFLSNTNIGVTTAPTGLGVSVNTTALATDGTAHIVQLNNNSIRSAADAFQAVNGGPANSLRIGLNTNTFQSTGAGSLAIDIQGGAAANTFITGLTAVTVTGNGTGGGVFFDDVTFDADPDTVGIDQVTGDFVIGSGTNANQRVAGTGLSITDSLGNLAISPLIVRSAGTGVVLTNTTPNLGEGISITGATTNINSLTQGLLLTNADNFTMQGATVNAPITIGGTGNDNLNGGANTSTQAYAESADALNTGAGVIFVAPNAGVFGNNAFP